MLPADQADFPTAIAFVNALIRAGVTVHRATAPFTAQGKTYPAGSLVVLTAQAFRPHVLDMFEPQDHPDDFQYPGGPPIPPYDSAGWTLAMQMGVQVDRILEAVEGPFERVADELGIPPGRVTGAPNATAYLFSHESNQAFRAVNRLLKAGERVEWLPDGRFRVAATSATRARLTEIAAVTGVSFEGVSGPSSPGGQVLRPARLALWDRYGGSMPSGWLRLVLEQFEFPYEVVYTPQLDAGLLQGRFDVLILPDGAIPEAGAGAFAARAPQSDNIPDEYRVRIGAYSTGTTFRRCGRFSRPAARCSRSGARPRSRSTFGLPVGNKLVDAAGASLPAAQYYVPGSILRVKVDIAHPLAHGLRADTDVYFDNSPVFTLPADAQARGLTPIAWFDSPTPLRSGWAWGQQHLERGVGDRRGAGGEGIPRALRPGDHVPRPAARHVQVPLQRHPPGGNSGTWSRRPDNRQPATGKVAGPLAERSVSRTCRTGAPHRGARPSWEPRTLAARIDDHAAIVSPMLAALAVVGGLTAVLSAQPPGAWQSLVDAERAFATHSVRTTMREAFLAHLHPKSLMFSPGPVNGIALYSGMPVRPGQLAWAPQVVDVAMSGDFGYSLPRSAEAQ